MILVALLIVPVVWLTIVALLQWDTWRAMRQGDAEIAQWIEEERAVFFANLGRGWKYQPGGTWIVPPAEEE